MRGHTQRRLAMVWRPAPTEKAYRVEFTDEELEELRWNAEQELDYPDCGDDDCAHCGKCDAPPF